MTTTGSLTKNKYTIEGQARDNGNTELHATSSAVIRIDTCTPTDVVLSFSLDISRTTYLANEETFLTKLEEVYRVAYTTAVVKRWCIHETSTR